MPACASSKHEIPYPGSTDGQNPAASSNILKKGWEPGHVYLSDPLNSLPACQALAEHDVCCRVVLNVNTNKGFQVYLPHSPQPQGDSLNTVTLPLTVHRAILSVYLIVTPISPLLVVNKAGQ